MTVDLQKSPSFVPLLHHHLSEATSNTPGDSCASRRFQTGARVKMWNNLRR